MDRVIYTGMSGARHLLERQGAISNNIANASTSGFRAELSALRAVQVAGPAGPQTRTSVAAASAGTDFSQGPVQTTGRELDIAIDGSGWLAVETDNGEAYTRRGDLQISSEGLLTVAGQPVQGEGGPILIPLGSEVFIGADGTLSAIGEGEDPNALAPIGRLKLVDPGEQVLQRGEDGWFRLPPNAEGEVPALALDETVQVTSGSLEGSNVSTVHSMVEMIGNARQYEMQMKVISNAEENDKRANSLLSIQS